jgi:hypothetical protein
MTEERKPVVCRCGQPMQMHEKRRRLKDGRIRYAVFYRCADGWESPKAVTHHPNGLEGARKEALLLATRRPPNLPLTKEQIMGMDDGNAVWYVPKDEREKTDSPLDCAGAIKELIDVYCEEAYLFAAKPTPADIDAARKISGAEQCISCGAPVPEGRQVCPICERKEE